MALDLNTIANGFTGGGEQEAGGSSASSFFGALAGDLREIGKTWAINEINGDSHNRNTTQAGNAPASPAGQPAPTATATGAVTGAAPAGTVNLMGLQVNKTAALVAGVSLAAVAVILIVR